MAHSRSLRFDFDTLETRRLLSASHVAAHHPKAATAAAPLVLNGTLTVDNKVSSSMMNFDGSTTISTPVSGQLATLGAVHGTWLDGTDQYGDDLGTNILQLHAASGSVTIAFSDLTPGKIHHVAGGGMYTVHPQRLQAGTGAYHGTSESGSIEMTTNAARSVVQSFTLSTTTK